MKKLKLFYLAVLGCMTISVCFAETSSKDQYIEVYSKYVVSQTSIISKGMVLDGIPKEDAEQHAEEFVSKSISCHINYLDDYPEVIQTALYDTIVSGGSYPDANAAVENVLMEAHFEGNDALIEKFMEVSEAGIQCSKSSM